MAGTSRPGAAAGEDWLHSDVKRCKVNHNCTARDKRYGIPDNDNMCHLRTRQVRALYRSYNIWVWTKNFIYGRGSAVSAFCPMVTIMLQYRRKHQYYSSRPIDLQRLPTQKLYFRSPTFCREAALPFNVLLYNSKVIATKLRSIWSKLSYYLVDLWAALNGR